MVSALAAEMVLPYNKDVKKQDITALDFHDKLSNDDCLKYVFVVFYASLLYFISKEMSYLIKHLILIYML